MKKWIQENPWLAVLVAIVAGAMFFAGPIALLVLKAKALITGHTPAAGGAAANPQETVSQKATH